MALKMPENWLKNSNPANWASPLLVLQTTLLIRVANDPMMMMGIRSVKASLMATR